MNKTITLSIGEKNFELRSESLYLSLDVSTILDSLTEEDRMRLAEHLCWGEIMKEAVNRLVDDSPNWRSDDQKIRLDFLLRVETRLLSGYKWDILRDLNTLAKNLTSHRDIYWLMVHDENEERNRIFRDFFREKGIESNYTHKLPDYESLKKLVEDNLSEAASGIKAGN